MKGHLLYLMVAPFKFFGSDNFCIYSKTESVTSNCLLDRLVAYD